MKTNKPVKVTCLKRYAGLFAACLIIVTTAKSQGQLYDNFEGTKVLHYGERAGVLDTLAKNPEPNSVNSSAKCGLYVRNGSKKFANIKMNLSRKLTNVEAYATYLGIPPKLKLKVYTSAPPGTLVEILLGARNGNNDYPAGTHSQYQAYTTKSNEWEELEFKFAQIPQGSETAANQIDQAVLLFNPNSSTSDTYYFDDLTGPPMAGIEPSQNITEEKNNDNKKDSNTAEKNNKDKSTRKDGNDKKVNKK